MTIKELKTAKKILLELEKECLHDLRYKQQKKEVDNHLLQNYYSIESVREMINYKIYFKEYLEK